MFWADKLAAFTHRHRDEPKFSDPEDMRALVKAAYGMLADANRRAIQVPSDVIEVITTAKAVNSETLEPQLEAKLWNAYGLLRSSIQPAENARRFYRTIFYIVLVLLLAAQFFFLAGDNARVKIDEINLKLLAARGDAAAAVNDPKRFVETSGTIEELLSSRTAYIAISGSLLDLAGSTVSLPLRLFGEGDFFSTRTPGLVVENTKEKLIMTKIQMLLTFLSGYLLPMVYGLLGACAFVLRKLSDEIDKLTYAHDARVRYSLRLNIGMLAGLAIGWFVQPGVSNSSLPSLSPLALAFIAGYGSELFFVALDRLVAAFSPSNLTSDRTVKDVTMGNVTEHSEQVRNVRVAGTTEATTNIANPKKPGD